MSVGAIGNVVLVNQMTPAVTPVQGNQYTRFDLQNVAAQTAVQEKEKEIEEVRPTEESHKIDPDREHQREEADEETQNLPKKKNHKIVEEESEEESDKPLHLLDIKV
ncbi:conserved hypothetical protein [Sulfurimonas autotrophica DSM 16294]|uniref:Uncharacterized protein n=2 Tax=Sulfurimonas autotrophica TaxID=202747 RepID=E0USW9_SULAO|nr:conserved hypothetical protein [Sulfurimonas autotrophica DSM 16294]